MDKKQKLKVVCELDRIIGDITKVQNEVTTVMETMKKYSGQNYIAKEYGVPIEVVNYYYKKHKTLPLFHYTNEVERKKVYDMFKLLEREMKLRRIKRKSSFFGRLFKLK